ncbi:MAG: SBBP repeat-containing protein [Promethearchaeota archaeon]
MKNAKTYLVGLILILYFSFFLQGINITSTQQDKKDKRNEILPLTASSSYVCVWNRTWDDGPASLLEICHGIAVDSSGNVYIAGEALYQIEEGKRDMVLVKYDGNGVQQWNRTWGGAEMDQGYAVVVDSSDNVYLAGHTTSFGAVAYDIVLVKYDTDGVLQWNRTWDGGDYDGGYAVAVDSSDNAYVAGYTYNVVAGGHDIVLVKYDTDGLLQWNRTWDAGDYDYGYAVAVDSSDNVYVAGYTWGLAPGDMDLVLVKYDENGLQQWNQTCGKDDWDEGYGLAVDSLNNVYLTGYIRNSGSNDIFLVKYDGNGMQQWNHTWDGGYNDCGRDVAVDSSDNAYVTGYTQNLGGENYDMILVKYDENGMQQWNSTFDGGIDDDFSYGVAIDQSDYVYIAGEGPVGGWGIDMILAKFGPDIYDPIITIINPQQIEVFGADAPDFNITIKEPNLNYTWYTIDDGLTNITFYGFTGTINQTEWDKKSDYEEITVIFYANDTSGNIGSKSVVIWKDAVSPRITIDSPLSNQLCGVNAPTFSLSIDEPNIQSKSYSINGRPNVTFTIETQINQTEWNFAGNGTVSIIFYVTDESGNTNSSNVIVRKDAYIPEITIHSPIENEKFGKNAPNFNISIIEEDLFSTWYTIEGVAGTFPCTSLVDNINQDAWDNVPNGEITITFFAQDRAGNIGSEDIIVIKSIPSEPKILGFNLFFLLGVLSVVVPILRKKIKKN